MKRAIVVGVGGMGEMHAREYLRTPEVELVGLVESDAERRELLAARFQVPVLAAYEPLVGQADLVSICTPDHLHVNPSIAFLRAGARVLVEKPLATSVADARLILEASGPEAHLFVGHVLRFDSRVIRSRELVRSGAIGDILQVHVWRKVARHLGEVPAGRTSAAWFLGVHDADLVRHVTGLTVTSLMAVGRRVFSSHEDIVHALVTYSNGAIGTMDNCWTLPAGRANRALAGLRLIGSEASLELDLGHVDLTLSTSTTSSTVDTRFWPGDDSPGYWNLRGEVRAFAGVTGSDADLLADGAAGLAAVSVVEAIHSSLAKAGSIQEVEATSSTQPTAGGRVD
jgi:predicted dehydrogenase